MRAAVLSERPGRLEIVLDRDDGSLSTAPGSQAVVALAEVAVLGAGGAHRRVAQGRAERLVAVTPRA